MTGTKALNSLTLGERAGTARGFSSIPFTAVLRNNVIEKRGEDIREPRGVGVVGVVSRAEVESLALAR